MYQRIRVKANNLQHNFDHEMRENTENYRINPQFWAVYEKNLYLGCRKKLQKNLEKESLNILCVLGKKVISMQKITNS